MPFPMKIQPIDFHPQPAEAAASARLEPAKPAAKSRFKRLFERQFTSVIRISAAPEKPASGAGSEGCNGSGGEFEPSSACLAKMVRNFIEGGSNERQLPPSAAASCSRNPCNCFNGSCNDVSEDEFELFGGFCEASKAATSVEGCEILKGLVLCGSISERNLLADTARIVERNNKICKRNDETCKKIVTNGLLALGYDASVCKSRWEKSPSCPAGEYEYVDVIIEGERYLIDVDFRSEFEIARPTKAYKTIIQALPHIYVGKSDRLRRIVSVVSDAAKQSLKKKGMPVPPWRKPEYVMSKWLSPHASARGAGPSPGVAAAESGESAAPMEEWILLPRKYVGFGVKKKVTAGLASVMVDDEP